MIIELRTDLHVTVKNLIDSSNGEAAAITAANGAGINRFMRCNDIADDNAECVPSNIDRRAVDVYNDACQAITESEEGENRLYTGVESIDKSIEGNVSINGSDDARHECDHDLVDWVNNRSDEKAEENRNKRANTGVDSLDGYVNDRTYGADDRAHNLPTIAEADDDRTLVWDDKIDESMNNKTVDRGRTMVSLTVPEAGDDSRFEKDDTVAENCVSEDSNDISVVDRPARDNVRIECELDSSRGEVDALTAVNGPGMIRLIRGKVHVDEKSECDQSNNHRLAGNENIECEDSLNKKTGDRGRRVVLASVPEAGEDLRIQNVDNTDDNCAFEDRDDNRIEDRPACNGEKSGCEYDSSNGEAAAIIAANGAGINWVMRCNDNADDNAECVPSNIDRLAVYVYNNACQVISESNTGVDSLDGYVNDRTNDIEHRKHSPAPEDETSCFEFPLLADITSRERGLGSTVWVDPIAIHEIGRQIGVTNKLTRYDLPRLTVGKGSHHRRPRGRPKKPNERLSCETDVKNPKRSGRMLETWEGDTENSRSALGRSFKQQTPKDEPPYLETHLLAGIESKADGMHWDDRLDPMVVVETREWSSIAIQQPQVTVTDAHDMADGSIGSHFRRPRGRPKKSNQPSLCTTKPPSISKGASEAHQSWETAKLLGISSIDEKAVITEIRKSKRILIMEDMEA